jgi:hypothetical protein
VEKDYGNGGNMARLRKEPYLVNEPTFLNPWETIDYGKRKVCRGAKGRFAPAIVCEMEEKNKTKKKKITKKTRKQEPEILNPILEGGIMESLTNPMEELMIINPRKRSKKVKKSKRVSRKKTLLVKPIRKRCKKCSSTRSYIKNPIDFKDFGSFLKDSAMVFIGFAGTNYLFYIIGNKVPVLATPSIKAIAKLGLAYLLEKKSKPIAIGMAISGMRDFIAMVSPQLAGQLSAMEQYIPEPEVKEIEQYLPQPENVSQYLPEPNFKEVNSLAELQYDEEF